MEEKSKFTKFATAFVLIGGAGFAGIFLLGGAVSIATSPELWEIAMNQFPATIGLPFAALGSLWIVMFLENNSGPMEFEALGFKFKGSSGPVVLWIMCFVAIAICIKLLWIQDSA